ncbi:MAG: Bacterial regulatory protein luxR family, partial [Armatimonadetes bacterium]|nr:Bacterial regulatory protein luxR family [Armatimonadota bacterium]
MDRYRVNGPEDDDFHTGADAAPPLSGQETGRRSPARVWLLARGLTRRQVDVALLASYELTNREIAARLCIEERTV